MQKYKFNLNVIQLNSRQCVNHVNFRHYCVILSLLRFYNFAFQM